MRLHQNCVFSAVNITNNAGTGTLLSAGFHPYSELIANFPSAFTPGGSGSISIVPYGTPFDGDVVFAVSTAAVAAATPLQVEALAALALPEAVERAVRLARGARDIPGLADGGR